MSVAVLERRVLVVEELAALEPGHGEEPLGRQLGHDLGHADALIVREDGAVEPRVARLQLVVELLAQPRGDLLQDLAGLDRRRHARVDGEHGLELREIGLDGRGHVGVLQLDGQAAAHRARRPCAPGRATPRLRRACRSSESVIANRRPSSTCMRRLAKAGPMAGAADCNCASSRAYSAGSASGMVESSCATFISGPLRPAERGGELGSRTRAVVLDAEQPLAGDARGKTADVGADAHVARGSGGKPVLLVAHRRSWLQLRAQDRRSSHIGGRLRAGKGDSSYDDR